jgi:hypothetical protein
MRHDINLDSASRTAAAGPPRVFCASIPSMMSIVSIAKTPVVPPVPDNYFDVPTVFQFVRFNSPTPRQPSEPLRIEIEPAESPVANQRSRANQNRTKSESQADQKRTETEPKVEKFSQVIANPAPQNRKNQKTTESTEPLFTKAYP